MIRVCKWLYCCEMLVRNANGRVRRMGWENESIHRFCDTMPYWIVSGIFWNPEYTFGPGFGCYIAWNCWMAAADAPEGRGPAPIERMHVFWQEPKAMSKLKTYRMYECSCSISCMSFFVNRQSSRLLAIWCIYWYDSGSCFCMLFFVFYYQLQYCPVGFGYSCLGCPGNHHRLLILSF